MSATLTDRHKHLMRHALGLTRATAPYRNFFCTEPDTEDDVAWREIVALGCAEAITPRGWVPGNVYRVTDAGLTAVEAVPQP